LRVLITGASGFAGGHLAQACARAGDEVIGISRRGSTPTGAGLQHQVDLLDADAVQSAVRDARPEVVYHLAALSSVGRSWEEPARTLHENVASATNMLEALRLEAPRARVIWVSSCEVYGPPDRLPVDEQAALRPANPYAVSKATGDLLAAMYQRAHGLDIVRVRPFNHVGPGQLPIFVLGSLTKQAAEARIANVEAVEIVTGNPHTRRDYTDVRDVVRAYRLLVKQGEPDVYNVSSGISVSTSEQVALLEELLAPIRVTPVVDPARVRANEVMEVRGSHDRLTAETGWTPSIPLRDSIRDAVAHWEQELTEGRRRGSTGSE
jgi:GDP-4-dehydro-6-deoxy-D-mannose reductase